MQQMQSSSEPWLLLIFLILMLILSAFFSGTETSVLSLNRYRLKHKANKGDKVAKKLFSMISKPDKFLVLVLIGNNLVNICASSIATILALEYCGNYAIAISTFGLTLIVLIFCEITPKTIAAVYPEYVARKASGIIHLLMIIASPVVIIMSCITKTLIKMFGFNDKKRDDSLTTDEIKSALIGESNTIISNHHKQLLLGVLDLEHISVEEIMVPRTELFAINVNDPWVDILKQLSNIPHTRILFFRDSLDDVIGFLHTRDILRLLSKSDFSKENLLRFIEEPYFVPENTNLLVQIQKFRRNKRRSGLVVDEFGDIKGLITLDDILEEIVGDFTTSIGSFDEDEIEEQKDGSYLVDGQTNIRDLNKELDWNIDTSGPVTINGIILEKLGDNPKKNDEIDLGGYKATILNTNGISVLTAKIIPLNDKTK